VPEITEHTTIVSVPGTEGHLDKEKQTVVRVLGDGAYHTLMGSDWKLWGQWAQIPVIIT
jgi:hypothetical protein